MAYSDAVTVASDTAFQSRVRAAMYAGCARIGSGSFVDDVQRNHFLGLMNMVVSEPDLYVTAFSWVLAAYVGLTTTCTDADLDAAITNLWPAISGYVTAGS